MEDFYNSHKTHANAADAAADAVLHGTDLECGEAYRSLEEAVKDNKITEKDIDVSVKRLFMTRFRLGMFEPTLKVSYDTIPLSVLESKSHQEHALKMAHESMVLLKNKNSLLPLSKKIKRIVIVGSNACDKEILLGNYNGFPTNIITPLERLQSLKSVKVIYNKGTDYITSNTNEENEALSAMKDADLVIFVGGISPRLEGEEFGDSNTNPKGFYGGDRTNIALPTVQTEFMKKVKKMGKPLVFVCMSGSAIGFEWEAENADAILQAWYGGQSAGTAITDILNGNYNPSGKLPVTFYKNSNDLPPMEDYSMANRTYRYFKGTVLYPFGFGLSYTNFDYKWAVQPQKTVADNDTLSFSVTVRNTGKSNGDEVSQVYIQYPSGNRFPLSELKQFKRVTLLRNKEQKLEF